MKKNRVVLGSVLLVLFLGVQTPQFAQDTSTGPTKADQARHRFAIGLLRSINTTELTYHTKNGSFVVWATLVSGRPENFDGLLAIDSLPQASVHFSDAPEILPGWNLRLNVHPDGRGYDVLLRDMTDESGVIRQSKVIDCEI